ncbi:DeoR/GlpR family DNA-binding transcription regulator [Bacillus massilinigeriensis]|uniref:DeoR/GlpR family DNA-binding transcription regulator n=1 Tax=Bacillus massilionigeriensis TaxID=1805475 RepID=UPI00096B3D1D|nr:DeoR/GlpR family DNA-binding transcription regulator [Bacillus massilionigeriensis]
MINRHSKIIEIVNGHKKIEVSKLADLLDVSQVTIRKDLGILEEKGFLRREHGYAVVGSSDDINRRLAMNYDIKRKIAHLAAHLVKDGETIMIESGSSCALLAAELANNKRDVTIITNSVFIATFIKDAPFAKVILLGGDYQTESQVLIGPLAKKGAADFFVDKLFLGTDGYSPNIGFTGSNLSRTETVQAMARSANRVIILTDSSKFSQHGVVAQFNIEEVDSVITDANIPDNILKELRDKKVHVQMVQVD